VLQLAAIASAELVVIWSACGFFLLGFFECSLFLLSTPDAALFRVSPRSTLPLALKGRDGRARILRFPRGRHSINARSMATLSCCTRRRHVRTRRRGRRYLLAQWYVVALVAIVVVVARASVGATISSGIIHGFPCIPLSYNAIN
jgi:hypothetical protein